MTNTKLLTIGVFMFVISVLAYAVNDKHMPSPTTNTPLPKSMIASQQAPNAPSLARVSKDLAHKKLSVKDWESPEICGSCHTTQYQGWKGSMHSNAFKDPIFQAEWALAEKALGGNISKLCAGCHTPPGMLSDSIKFDKKLGKHGGFTTTGVAKDGVSCDVCHTISGTSFQNSSVIEHGNGSYISSPGKIKRGPLKNAKSPYHETAYSQQHTQASFCANCHNIFNPINQFPLERTYDEWKYSVYAQNNVQCQDCHMVPVETAIRVADELKPARELANHGLGGKAAIGAQTERDLIHGHAFVGGNSVITAQLGDPDSYEKSLIAKKRLRSAAELEVSIKKIKNQGALHNLTVKVINQRAGHHMPTSLTFIRELWLHIQVSDQNNRLIFESGAIDGHNEVDTDATMFKAYAVDKHGKPANYIWTVERFERRTTIPPKGHQYGRYSFNIPKGTTELRVRTKLNYRSFSQHFVDHLLGKGKIKVPKVVMNDLKTVYNATNLALKSSVNFSEIDEVEAEGNRLLEAYLNPKAAIQEQKRLIQACSVCHGKNGISTKDEYPNLAGQNEIYLLSALRAYKSGSRKESKMNAMIKDVSDSQLQALAAHYAKTLQ